MTLEDEIKKKIFKYKCAATIYGTIYKNPIQDTMKKYRWIEAEKDSDDWDVIWCEQRKIHSDLELWNSICFKECQRVGHFQNCFEISMKDRLTQNLRQFRDNTEVTLGIEESAKFNFFPMTFILPTEHKNFIDEFGNNPDRIWIIKPTGGYQGNGIHIFGRMEEYMKWLDECTSLEHHTLIVSKHLHCSNSQHEKPVNPFQTEIHISCTPDSKSSSVKQMLNSNSNTNEFNGLVKKKTINKDHHHIIQRYISNPYLIDGKKVDIRFHVLVTSFVPLKAWMYREGFVRFATNVFSLEKLEDAYVHITNLAIQKSSEKYDVHKSRWSLLKLRKYMTVCHGEDTVQTLMNEIDTIVICTLQSVQFKIIQNNHCFELYGFDVIIDSNLKPWLLEVNSSPTFTEINEDDYLHKCSLLDDILHILNLEKRLTGYERRVGGFDLFWTDGPIYANNSCVTHVVDGTPKLNTFLGKWNNKYIWFE